MSREIKKSNKRFWYFGIIILCIIILTLFFFFFNDAKQSNQTTQLNSSQNIASNLKNGFEYQRFSNKITSLGYDTFLQGEGPFTIFMPTDDAYNKLPTRVQLELNDISKEGTVRQILLYHIVKGQYLTTNLTDGMTLETIQGESLVFNKKNDKWYINDMVQIETADNRTKNGVIHTVDNYLLPDSLSY